MEQTMYAYIGQNNRVICTNEHQPTEHDIRYLEIPRHVHELIEQHKDTHLFYLRDGSIVQEPRPVPGFNINQRMINPPMDQAYISYLSLMYERYGYIVVKHMGSNTMSSFIKLEAPYANQLLACMWGKHMAELDRMMEREPETL